MIDHYCEQVVCFSYFLFSRFESSFEGFFERNTAMDAGPILPQQDLLTVRCLGQQAAPRETQRDLDRIRQPRSNAVLADQAIDIDVDAVCLATVEVDGALSVAVGAARSTESVMVLPAPSVTVTGSLSTA